MNSEDKKGENSQFTSMNHEDIEILTEEPTVSSPIEVLEEDVVSEEIEKKPEITQEAIDEDEPMLEEENSFHSSFYYGFEARITTMVLASLFLFAIGCFFILKTISFGKEEVITYTEEGQTSYHVCLVEHSNQMDSCLGEDQEYVASSIDKVNIGFDYNATFSKNVSYPLKYHVVGIMKIYDGVSSEKVLYENEDLLIEKEKASYQNRMSQFHTNVDLDFQKYYQYVIDYKEKNQLEPVASYDVVLYLDEEEESREISSVRIPLGNPTVDIVKKELTENTRKANISNNKWNQKTVIETIIAVISLLSSLFLLYRTILLLLKVTTKKDKYQSTIDKLLKHYEKDIIIAQDGYDEKEELQVIKVDSFDELKKVHDTLQKPIIYSKVNDIKSMFIVEDEHSMYKYVLKKVDLEE